MTTILSAFPAIPGLTHLRLSRRFLVRGTLALVLLSGFLPVLRAEAPASAPAAASGQARQSTETVVRFFSESLNRSVEYVALTPHPLEPGRRYPVLFLLHGAYGSYRDWPTQTSATVLLAGRPMIVITPDGGQFGWYADSPLLPGSRYESFVIRDLIRDVDARFPTSGNRQGRGIAGLSMGGHGAVSLAAKHPDLFASASSMSGILHLRNHPTSWKLHDTFGDLPGAEAEWRQHSAFDLADRFTTAGVRLRFDSGTSDTAAISDNRQFHERLEELRVPHTYTEYPGGHTWNYWRARLPEHLAFHEQAFAGAGY